MMSEFRGNESDSRNNRILRGKAKWGSKIFGHHLWMIPYVNTKLTLQITFRSMELIKNIASMKIFKGHKNIISKKEVLNNCRF